MARNFTKGSMFEDLVPAKENTKGEVEKKEVDKSAEAPILALTDSETDIDVIPLTVAAKVSKKKPPIIERKTRRVQLLLKESTVKGVDMYARDNGLSRNEVIQTVLDKLLVSEGYTKK